MSAMTPLDIVVADGAWLAGPRLVMQGVDAAIDEPVTPLPHRVLMGAYPRSDLGIGAAMLAGQNNPAAQR
jgi:hypothetical protein